MDKEIKPIKRSNQLAPLSREHHETLLLAWKIRQGIRLNIESDRIVSYCSWFGENFMERHFSEEEVEFGKILHSEDPLLIRMRDEHRQIRLQLKNIAAIPTPEQLELLAKMITDHVRFEERQLFNYIEEKATEEQLNALLQSHIQGEKQLNWEDEFWLNKPI